MVKQPIPPALVVGFSLSVVADLVRLVTGLADTDAPVRWHLFAMGSLLAEYMLVTFGLFELARRAAGPARSALRIAATLYLVLLVWYAANPLLDLLWGRSEAMFTIFRWSHVMTGATSLVIAISVAIAAQGFRRVPVAAGLVIVAVLARGWIPYVTDGLSRYLWEHRTLGLVYWTTIGAMWAGGMLWLVATIAGDAAPAAADPHASAAGLRRAASALRFRIIAAIVLAVMTVGMVRSMGAAKFVVIGGPLVMVATMVVCALGLLAAARGAVPGLPRLRIVIGAAITLWWCGVQLTQLSWVYRGLTDGMSTWRDNQDWISSWSIAGPLLATVGLGLVGSAISAFAAARADDELREAASVRSLLFVVLLASSVGIQTQLHKASSIEGFVMLSFIAAGAGIGALIALLGLMTRAADVMGTAPSLPSARIVE